MEMCPVCIKESSKKHISGVIDGIIYYFCCKTCRRNFLSEPRKYANCCDYLPAKGNNNKRKDIKMVKKTVKTKKNKIKDFKKVTLNCPIDLNKEIQAKAYELYEKRGCCHGKDSDDWFEAEKILRS